MFISEPYADILTYDSAAVRFESNRALSGGAITIMRNVQVCVGGGRGGSAGRGGGRGHHCHAQCAGGGSGHCRGGSTEDHRRRTVASDLSPSRGEGRVIHSHSVSVGFAPLPFHPPVLAASIVSPSPLSQLRICYTILTNNTALPSASLIAALTGGNSSSVPSPATTAKAISTASSYGCGSGAGGAVCYVSFRCAAACMRTSLF